MELTKNEINVDVIHIGNTGNRCQFPVYKVFGLDKEYTVTPAWREVTYIYEIKTCEVLKRRVVKIENKETTDWLLKKISDFFSESATLLAARPSEGGAV